MISAKFNHKTMSHNGECKHDDPTMCGCRARTHKGLMRKVRNDKTAEHIEEQYGVTVPGRSDQQLKTLLKKYGVLSQSKLLKILKKKS